MDAAALRERATDVPREPGVYQFLDGTETVLYVGKAVDLRDRVRSYVDPRSRRIRQMVERAETLDYAVTDTETQALLLEANLIKRHQPRYNVRLKDDKSYPLVQLTDHPVPRIEVTRDPEDSATAFGPFTNVGRVNTVVKAAREVYGVRGCSDHKYANRDRPCLEYDVGQCSAPCVDYVDEATYNEDVTSVKRFFAGETGVLAEPLRREMAAASQAHEYERAANLRDKLDAVEAFHGGAGDAVSAPAGREQVTDVLGVVVAGERATVARLRSERGQLVDRERHTVDAPDAEEGVAGVLSAFVPQYYAERDLPDALLLPERPDDPEVERWLDHEGVAVRVPGAGREATLVDLALKNARRGGRGTDRARDESIQLTDALSGVFSDLPRVTRIEGFDVSHAQGKAAVGSNVCFVDGAPEKSAYRRKKLDEQNDDYANMQTLVRWRAERALDGTDDRPDPDLLLIDGGESQLGAAHEALAETGWDVPCVALAKAEERVVTHDGSFQWPSDAPHLHLLQRVRDEAHRFAVQYHQIVRDEVSTALDGVPGVGPKTRRALLRRFGSVENVRAASNEALQTVEGVGPETARTLKRQL